MCQQQKKVEPGFNRFSDFCSANMQISTDLNISCLICLFKHNIPENLKYNK